MRFQCRPDSRTLQTDQLESPWTVAGPLELHVLLGVRKEVPSSIIETEGNPRVHVILRGGSKGM